MVKRYLKAMVLVVFTGPVMAIEPLPGAVLEEERETGAGRYRIVLGALEKVNNVLEPEVYKYVRGRQSSKTYSLPGERNVDPIAEYYLGQLTNVADILFECEGRSCGSSNYWANTVFDTPILYGPEQFQYYVVGQEVESADYVAIYIGQRGTREIYVHVSRVIAPQGENQRDQALAIRSALESTGKYVLHLETGVEARDDFINAVSSAMASDPELAIVLVGHDRLRTNETLDAAMTRTRKDAETLRQQIIGAGVAAGRVRAQGVGPLAPADAGAPARIVVLTQKVL